MVIDGVNVGTAVRLENWCAYLPDMVEGQEQPSSLLSADDALNVSFLPAMKRRRLSNLSKLCLRLAHTVAPDFQGYCVFGSQHGELVTTQALLESIVQGEIVSPAGFSSSVHNTAVGLHSINCKNTYPCTSIAAGTDTLAMCFIEAYALLKSGEADKVLLVCADDVVPDGLASFVDNNELRGFAAVIKKADAKTGGTLILSQEGKREQTERNEAIRLVASFLYNSEQDSVLVPGETGQWRWQYKC